MQNTKIKISITKEQVTTLPTATFNGEITVIDSPDKVAGAVSELRCESVIGFDTETRPSFQKGKVNKVALMQLSTDTKCYLFRLNRIGIGQELCELLEDNSISKIGLSVHDDFNVMHRSSTVQPKGFVELQDYVKEFSIQDISLQKIYAIIFGERISKSQRLTNWEAGNLTPQQQTYAATDAWACLRIYHYLKAGQFDPTTSPYILADNPDQTAATDGQPSGSPSASAKQAPKPQSDGTPKESGNEEGNDSAQKSKKRRKRTNTRNKSRKRRANKATVAQDPSAPADNAAHTAAGTTNNTTGGNNASDSIAGGSNAISHPDQL